jgi:hypothetical protein
VFPFSFDWNEVAVAAPALDTARGSLLRHLRESGKFVRSVGIPGTGLLMASLRQTRIGVVGISGEECRFVDANGFFIPSVCPGYATLRW